LGPFLLNLSKKETIVAVGKEKRVPVICPVKNMVYVLFFKVHTGIVWRFRAGSSGNDFLFAIDFEDKS
jgi:hypothetical protein